MVPLKFGVLNVVGITEASVAGCIDKVIATVCTSTSVLAEHIRKACQSRFVARIHDITSLGLTNSESSTFAGIPFSASRVGFGFCAH